ncbi:MAG: hypothetical protein ABEH78_10705 [Haloferacaceae archaeon]
MTREELSEASDLCRQAAEGTTGDTRERLYEQSNQLAQLADRDRDPDHGRLARHMNALDELAEEADGETADLVEEARDLVGEYRQGVEGV